MTPREAKAVAARINAGSLRSLGLDGAYITHTEATSIVVAYAEEGDREPWPLVTTRDYAMVYRLAWGQGHTPDIADII